MTKIKLYTNKWRDPALKHITPTGQIGDETPHGMTRKQIDAMYTHVNRTGQQVIPKFSSAIYSPTGAVTSLFNSVSPEGPESRIASLSPTMDRSLNTMLSPMQPYKPQYDTDKLMFPQRGEANEIWRMVYKTHPIVGSVVKMFGELTFGDFHLTGEGVDGEIKEMMEEMIRRVDLSTNLPFFSTEIDVTGEVIPQLHFDESDGIWDHLALHNPDRVNVVYSPFINMDPLLEFVPDEALRQIATNSHPMLVKVRESMPVELLSALKSGRNIPLSPENVSFIANKSHPYDLRGTSILARIWRSMIAENALWEAFTQTARRAANAVKVVMVGDASSGYIPDNDEMSKIIMRLAQAESDPAAWLAFNYAIKHEMWGAPDRLMSINTHYDLFERIVLTALGVSKSFIAGEVSYSSSAAGLTIFLQRLKARREFFVNKWLMPKFFLPVAEANEWIKPSAASKTSGGQVRVKKSSKDTNANQYILPTLVWTKTLDSNIEAERLDAYNAIKAAGMPISKQKWYAAGGLDSEEEQKQVVEELKFTKDLAGENPELQAALGLVAPVDPNAAGGAGAPMAMSPGIPPDAFGLGDAGGDMGGGGAGAMGGAPPPDTGAPPAPEGAAIAADVGAQATAPQTPTSAKTPSSLKQKPHTNELRHWAKETIDPLQALFSNFDLETVTDEEPWMYALREIDDKEQFYGLTKEIVDAAENEDKNDLWTAWEQWLTDENYPSSAIEEAKFAVMGPKKKASQSILRAAAKRAQASHVVQAPNILDAQVLEVTNSLGFFDDE